MNTPLRLERFIDAFNKAAAEVVESESVRPYRASDTARRLPGARSGLGGGVQSYTAPSPPSATTFDSSASARAVPPPPV